MTKFSVVSLLLVMATPPVVLEPGALAGTGKTKTEEAAIGDRSEFPADKPVAPDTFAVRFETTKGSFVVEAYRDWEPRAAERFFALVQDAYFDGSIFYSVSHGHFVGFGIHNNSKRRSLWNELPVPEDLPKGILRKGDISFHPTGRKRRLLPLGE
jgi:hypothetical protein